MAADLTPPRPPVDWSAVSHYGFLDEFHLLRDTRNDLRSKRWAQPIFRNLMKVRHRLARAKEELIRCNVEVRRLHTSIRDEQLHFDATLANLTGTVIHGAVQDFARRRFNVNQMLLDRISSIYKLQEFSGISTCGVRAGTVAPEVQVPDPIPRPPMGPMADVDIENEEVSDSDEDDDDLAEDDEIVGDIGGIVQYVTHL